MDIANFDALKAQGKILDLADVDPEEDYLLIGKYNNKYTTDSFKYTKYPVWAIRAKDLIAVATDGVTVLGDGTPGNPLTTTAATAVQSVTGLDTDNSDPLNPVVNIAVDGVTITGQGTPASPLSVIGIVNKTIQYVTPAPVINITAQPGEHYIMLGKVDGAIYPNIQFNLANPGAQSIGDKLYIVSEPDTTSANIQYCYNLNRFYVTECGGSSCVAYDAGDEERDITVFIYDGQKYCSTFDNC